MYEQYTFDFLLDRMLSRIPDTIDKREGSIIWDALSPAAAELAQMYIEMDVNQNLSFADTASGEFLSRRTAEFGVDRMPATKARRRGVFSDESNNPLAVPVGHRFGGGGINFVVVSQLGAGEYALDAETAGIIGNQYYGALLPIDYVDGLAQATLMDIIAPGADEETDESLRARYYEIVNEPAFGGNVSDYKRKVASIDGVGSVKVYPVWNGGGTVRLAIMAADWGKPSPQLINDVQTIIDPVVNSGKGVGTAPIGHEVTVTGADSVTVNVQTTIVLATGYTVGMVQGGIETVIAAYLLELRRDWANQQRLVVRTAQIDARILNVQGIDDVSDTLLNGAAGNLTLGNDDIPVLGAVTLNV
ncbi:baseplate J/gp47 family protein [Paenibacillaceae bacterium]|nr:baseplate J/gp47 family protein [Paenibacillaceae bacterium]